MNCFKCCNDYEEVKKSEDMPYIIYGIVRQIYDCNNIMISYKIDEKTNNFFHYYIKLSYFDPYPEKQDVAKKALAELILNKKVIIQDYKNITFNNMEAKVFYNDICVNNWLIYNKFGKRND